MDQFKEIYRFHLKRYSRNGWIYLGFLFNLVFLFLFASTILNIKWKSVNFVIAYLQNDIIMPFIIITTLIIVFFNESHGKVASLFDSYSFSNWNIFSAIFLASFTVFLIYSIGEFSIILMIRMVCLKDLSCLYSYWDYIYVALPSIFFHVCFGAFLGTIFREPLFAYIIAYGFQLLFTKLKLAFL